MTCKTKNPNESFALSFLGEISPQIYGFDGEDAIEASLMNLSTVNNAKVKLYRKVGTPYDHDEIIKYESSSSICDENGTSFALVYLNDVNGYAITDTLPLIKMTSKWTQTIYCSAHYNSSEATPSTLSFSFNGETSWSVPVDANENAVKDALE